MTLPVIAGSLIRAGKSESTIGRVYGVNTIGSVAGAALAGLIGLQWLGLKGLILAAAALDIALGLLLLERAARASTRQWRLFGGALAGSVLAFAAVGLGVRFDSLLLGSGVYRYGYLPAPGERQSLYYADGRTATVSAFLSRTDRVATLSTNGKPDASIQARWLAERRDTVPDRPIEAESDIVTQVLAPMIGLAHRPGARTVANIGHGSGMSATAFLTSPSLERLVTIEIEPLMVEGSLVFLPVNGPAFADARASYVFDDAKSYFSYAREQFDIVFAEPSNPWVSGTASLFTVEFYRRVRDVIPEGGVFTQWIQIYESNDDLFLSVVAALDAVFPWYKAYLVGDSDVAIIASTDAPLGDPDPTALDSERLDELLESAPPFRAGHLDALLLFDQTTMRPLVDRIEQPNSDFHPVLDMGAERARFERTSASGVFSFITSRVDLVRALVDERIQPAAAAPVPAYGLASLVLWGRAAWLRDAHAAGGGIAPEEFPEWQAALESLSTFLDVTRSDEPPPSWESWAGSFERLEAELHRGTLGWVDTPFYEEVYAFLDRADAPPVVRAGVDLRHAYARLEWDRAAAAAEQLVPRVALGERWVEPAVLLDIAVVAHLKLGRPAAARRSIELIERRTGRGSDDLRARLLDALVADAELASPAP